MSRRLRRCLGVFFVFFAVTVSGASERRELLQSLIDNAPVVVRDVVELQMAVASLAPSQTIFINSRNPLTLPSTLTVLVPGVTLRGRSDNTTTLNCPSNSTSALLIKQPRFPLASVLMLVCCRGVDVRVESLTFSGCQKASAVRLEPVMGTAFPPVTVSFSNVHFLRNGGQGEQVNGAAIRVLSCLNNMKCRRFRLDIESCTFLENHSRAGGALFLKDADVRIQKSTFSNNTAVLAGGAIFAECTEDELIIRDSMFSHNHATSPVIVEEAARNGSEMFRGVGGAISAADPHLLILRRNVFLGNTACSGGGALDVQMMQLLNHKNESVQWDISNCRFEENVAYCGAETELEDMELLERNFYIGGAISYQSQVHLEMSRTIRNSTFLRNRARYGGALYTLGAPESPLFIFQCVFEENVALGGGGGISVRNAQLRMHSTAARRNRALWGAAVMVWNGGRLETLPDPDLPAAINIVEDNTAIYGGGIHYIIGGGLELQSLTIRNNTAFRYGGGMRCFAAQASFSLQGVTLEDNRAMVGGGIAFFAAPLFRIDSANYTATRFLRNRAAVGGGLYFDTGHYLPLNVQIRNAEFSGNKASTDDIEELMAEGEDFRPWPTAPAMSSFEFMDFFREQSVVDILATVPAGHGGGICMTLANIQFFTVAEVTLENLEMQENEALVGGGVSMHFSDLFWNKGGAKHCFPATFGFDFCQRMYFRNITLHHNRAEYAGGLFTTHPDSIIATCDLENPRLDLTLADVSSRRIKAEHALDLDGVEADGADVGTSAKALSIEGLETGAALQTVASGETLILPCKKSPGVPCDPELKVLVKDAFNQTISRGIDDSRLELSLMSVNVAGAVRYIAENGTVVIGDTQARGIGISSPLTIQSVQDPSIQAQTSFSTRECYPGEFNAVDVCHQCPIDVYSFNSSLGQCQTCEDNAVCTGGAVLVPMDGYWHSTPFSPSFHRCIDSSGCTFPGREERLAAFYDDAARLQSDLDKLNAHIVDEGTLPDFPEYQQCAEGYEGVLCGSCQDGYGHNFRGECESCPAKGSKAGLLLAFAIFWTFVMIGLNCLVTLLSARTRIQVVHDEMRNQARHNRPRTLQRATEHIREDTAMSARLSRHNTLSDGASEISDYYARQLLSNQLMTTVQLTETLKILINYLQVTSSALRISVNWKAALNGLLSIEAGFVGVTNDAVYIPFECNFDSSHAWPPSILAIWMRALVPTMAICGLIVVYSVLWLIGHFMTSRRKDADGRPKASHLVTGIIVIFIVAVYFSYIDNMRELLRIVNCVRVDDSSLHAPDHPYRKYSMDRKLTVWAEDTDLTCFEGKHTPTGITGIIGLIMAFLWLIFIITWLPLNKKHATKTQFVARYWFIYQAYRKKWYTLPWEAAILVRKTLIAAVVVFAFQLGPNLQAAMCVGILGLAHTLQVMLQPFKVPESLVYIPDYAGSLFRLLHLSNLGTKFIEWSNSLSLNSLESASLLSSILVFFTAIILSDPNSSKCGIHLMSGLAVSINVAFLFYMLYRLYCGLHVLMDLKLEMESPAFMAAHENRLGFLHLLKKAAQVCRSSMHDYLEEAKPPVETEVAVAQEV